MLLDMRTTGNIKSTDFAQTIMKKSVVNIF